MFIWKINKNQTTEVLNGIAYNPKPKPFCNGKNWDKLFEIVVLE
jgi:glutamine cyclotransferase